MEAGYALRLVAYHQGGLALGVLSGDTSGAFARMAGLRLYASDGKHETARAVAPVGPHRPDPRHVERPADLARGAPFDLVAPAYADQRVVVQAQPFPSRGHHLTLALDGPGAGSVS